MRRAILGILVGLVVMAGGLVLWHLVLSMIAAGEFEAAESAGRPLRTGWMLLVLLGDAAVLAIAGYIAGVVAVNIELGTGAVLGLVACLVAVIVGLAVPHFILDEVFYDWYGFVLMVIPLPFALLGAYMRNLQTSPPGAGAV